MLDAVVFFGSLGVVPGVERAGEITGDAADAVELRAREMVAEDDLAVVDELDVDGARHPAELLDGAGFVGFDFPGGNLAAGDSDGAIVHGMGEGKGLGAGGKNRVGGVRLPLSHHMACLLWHHAVSPNG